MKKKILITLLILLCVGGLIYLLAWSANNQLDYNIYDLEVEYDFTQDKAEFYLKGKPLDRIKFSTVYNHDSNGVTVYLVQDGYKTRKITFKEEK